MALAIKPPGLGPSAEEIRSQILQILTSPAFQGSRRCRQFLEYVCDRSLAGEPGALKERAIAIEVFGRRPQSDLAEDTIVRVGAREVRKRLASYYGTPDGAAAKVRIDLPSGCYAPEFRYPDTVAPTLVLSPVAAEIHTAQVPAVSGGHDAGAAPHSVYGGPKQWKRRWTWFALAAALAVSAISFVAGRATHTAAPVTNIMFERFWGPVLKAREPLLLAVGHPLVYHPSRRALELSDGRLPPAPYPMQRPLRLAPHEMNASDLVPVMNQYVGFGDMVVATEVATMLGRRSKDSLVRMASSVPFADLRQSPTLLIGAITNRWTMELGQSWRFRFDRQEIGNLIFDSAADPPGSRVWAVPRREDGGAQQDYLLISRLTHSASGPLLIVAAGIKQFGTEAAGYLLSDPARLAAVLSQLPEGWETKNLQVVLRVQVIANTPATPEVVASHTW